MEEIECLVLNIPGKCESGCEFCYLKERLGGKWEDINRISDEITFTAKTIQKDLSSRGKILLSVPHNKAAIYTLVHQIEPLMKAAKEKEANIGVIASYKTVLDYDEALVDVIRQCIGNRELFISVPASAMATLPVIDIGTRMPNLNCTINLVLDKTITSYDIETMLETFTTGHTAISEINVTLPMSSALTGKVLEEGAQQLTDSMRALENAITKLPIYVYVSQCTIRTLTKNAHERTPCFAKVSRYAEIMNFEVHRECPYDCEKECDK